MTSTSRDRHLPVACLSFLAAGLAHGATIELLNVTDTLGPDFFIDAAATGGADFTFASQGFVRSFGALDNGNGGSIVTITGIGWACPNAPAVITATQVNVTITYLGDDGVVGGGDDTVVGSASDSFTFGGAGEYAWAFDTPMVATVVGGGTNFLIQIDTGGGNLRLKTTAGVDGVKFSVAGSSAAKNLADADGDGLADVFESNTGIFVSAESTGTDPADSDSDDDTLLDGEEVFGLPGTGFTCDPNKADTDGDGLNDDVENSGSANVLYSSGPTNPSDADSDDDGLGDREEIEVTGTDPNLADTDLDGLSDGDELNIHGTDPLSDDSDADGLPDPWEIANGLDPNDDGSIDVANGPDGDPDMDTLVNASEYNSGVGGTDPRDPDSDNDGLDDGFEWDSVGLSGLLNPSNRDSDGDGLGDGFEVANGLDPLADADFDTDGTSDFDEVMFYGTDPKSDASRPGEGTAPAVGGLTPITNFGVVGPTENLSLPPMAGDPASLGTAVVNEAAQGGNDLTYNTGVTDFTLVYPNAFPAAGTVTSITGFAWVVTSAGNVSGDIRVEFYDPEAADGDPDFDGVDTETFLGAATGTLTVPATTGVSYWAFETPIDFTSAGTSLAVRILGAGSLRIKAQNDIATGSRYSNQGRGPLANNRSVRLTLFGSAVAPGGVTVTGISRVGDDLTIAFRGPEAAAGSFTVSGSPDPGSPFDGSSVVIKTPVTEGAPGEYTVVIDTSGNGGRYFYRIED